MDVLTCGKYSMQCCWTLKEVQLSANEKTVGEKETDWILQLQIRGVSMIELFGKIARGF